MGADEDAQEGQDEGSKSPGIASIAAAAGALVSGVGALTLTGTLGRVQRNEGADFTTAIALVVIGAAILLAGGLISTKAAPWRPGPLTLALRPLAQGLGVAFALVGMVLGFDAAVDTARDTEKPRIEVRLADDRLAVLGTVEVDNLRSDAGLDIWVDGIVEEPYDLEPLGRTFVGPNADGEAVAKLNVQVPPGRFDEVSITAYAGSGSRVCGEEVAPDGTPSQGRKGNSTKAEGGTACATLPLPPRPARPQLDATWDGKEALSDTVKLTLSVVNAPGPEELVALRVAGLRDGRRVRLYRATVAPSHDGIARREVRLPVPASVDTVCAEAGFVKTGAPARDATCPRRRVRQSVASVELRR